MDSFDISTEIAIKVLAANRPPNWQRPLKSYTTFDWTKIAARPIAHDEKGVTQVLWMGHIYTRRSGSNPKYDAAIWFSRPNGKGDGDETQYAKLITFKDSRPAEALPDYVVKALH